MELCASRLRILRPHIYHGFARFCYGTPTCSRMVCLGNITPIAPSNRHHSKLAPIRDVSICDADAKRTSHITLEMESSKPYCSLDNDIRHTQVNDHIRDRMARNQV